MKKVIVCCLILGLHPAYSQTKNDMKAILEQCLNFQVIKNQLKKNKEVIYADVKTIIDDYYDQVPKDLVLFKNKKRVLMASTK